jgi:spoIIIJ-associated protein
MMVDDREPNGGGDEAEQAERGDVPAEERYGQAVPVVRSFLETVLGLLDVDVEVDIDIEEDGLHCDLNTTPDDGGLLIGRHGATLDALQYLTLRVLQAEGFPRMRITLDVAGYRTRREKTLRQLAQSVAAKVIETRRAYHFEPMSAMERRVVHMTISDMEGLVTESEGEGRKRHVVVFPERKGGKGPQD